MNTSRISRFVVGAASLLFAVAAAAIWAAPQEAARAFGLEAMGPAGTTSARAELGGLFSGMAVLCAVAARTGQRAWSLGAAAMLTSIVIGRIIGWIGNRAVGSDIPELAIELLVLAGLIGLAQRTSIGAAPSPTSFSPV